jgi:hypothetical protein
MTRRALNLSLAGLAALSVMPSCSAKASARRRLLQYKVIHSVYGDIGTYTNNIDEQDDIIIIRTVVRLSVSFLGIVLYRESADRIEHWADDRLLAFHGETTTNGNASLVTGEARGDAFVITSPQGTIVAPASVRPSNPWSKGFLRSDTMMLSDTGMIQHVRISQPTSVTIIINRGSMHAQEYRIDATPSYKVWLDERDIPVMFATYDDSGLVTFTLSRRA